MEYPKNGSIVIVDDKITDVEDLILAFSQKNVPSYYFSGKEDKLHRNLDNIKLIFLDASYEHNQQSTIATKADYMLRIVVRLINENAGDYIIIVWSTTSETYAAELDDRLRRWSEINHTLEPKDKIYRLPKRILALNKGDVKNLQGDFDLTKINKAINDVLDNNDIMNLSILWENNVLEAAKNVLRNFKKIAPTDYEQKNMFALFAKSITEKGSLNQSNIIIPSLQPISTLLTDQLAYFKNNEELNEIGAELLSITQRNSTVGIDKVSKVNTFYHVDLNPLSQNSPGTVFNYNQYMNLNSCSLNQCNTKWSEGLLEKLESRFIKINIDGKILKPFKDKQQEFKNIKFNYIDKKDYHTHFQIAEQRKFNLDDALKKFDDKFNNDLDEHEKKSFIQRYSKYKEKSYINELIKFIFKRDINSDILELLKSFSQNCNFDSLDNQEKENILEEYYKVFCNKKFIEDFNSKKIPIFLEFSPDCDFVQKNRKKLRLIFGLMYPYGINVESKNNFEGENYIYTPIIEYNGIPYKIVLDLHTITGINEKAFSKTKPMYRFRKELLVDIQQKIASHISRPGFFNMNDFLTNQ